MTEARTVGVAVIGAGVVSREYLATLKQSSYVRLEGIYDPAEGAAASRAEEFGVKRLDNLDDLLEHDGVDIVINLTPPQAHAVVTRILLSHDKDVWSEKPLAATSSEAAALIELAQARGRQIRCAPDTLLGSAFTEAQDIIAHGRLGRPISAFAALQSPGPDRWHTNPEFLFQQGGGPLRDIGPYYITALLQLLGAVESVWAHSNGARPIRRVQAGPRRGEPFDVQVATNVQIGLSFKSGASAVGIFSWDSTIRRKGVLEITGTDASLRLADPNTFSGSVTLVDADEQQHVVESYDDGLGRGLGVHRWATQYGAKDDSSCLYGLYFLLVVEAIERAEQSGQIERPEFHPLISQIRVSA